MNNMHLRAVTLGCFLLASAVSAQVVQSPPKLGGNGPVAPPHLPDGHQFDIPQPVEVPDTGLTTLHLPPTVEQRLAALEQEVEDLKDQLAKQRTTIDTRYYSTLGPPGLTCASESGTNPNDILDRDRTYHAVIAKAPERYPLGTIIAVWTGCTKTVQ